MRPIRARLSLAAAALVFLPALSTDADQRIHGPVVVWEEDPTTEATILWLERDVPPPVPTDRWLAGRAGFGFDAVGVVTELRSMAGHASRLALRKNFRVDEPSSIEGLELGILYDDAFVAYLNGREVARSGVIGDPSAPESIASHHATAIETFAIESPAEMLRPGENVLAIEAFNVNPRSADFVVSPRLRADTPDGPVDVIPWEATWQIHIGPPGAADWRRRVADPAPGAVRRASIPQDPVSIQYREGGSQAWRQAPAETHRFADAFATVRRVRLENLEPDTTYEFMAPDEPVEDVLIRRFRTAPRASDGPMTFVTGGDMYHRRDWLDAMNERAGAQDPLFALLGGDLAYANARSAERWYAWFDSWATHAVATGGRAIPMIVAIGNHETGPTISDPLAERYDVHPQAKFYASLFARNDDPTHHVVDVGEGLSVIVLDTNHVLGVSSQTDWLRETLESRAGRRWLFACYHRPAYGTGVKGDIIAVREEWSPLFERHGVAAVFENDHHIYKRTLPIRDGVVDQEAGVPYLGDGAWGVNVREIPDLGDRPDIAHAESVRHLIRVDLADSVVRCTALTADGRVIDTFVREASPAAAE